ncbi:uncharacterized protein LOC119083782 isoform X2 [Bradysia coprophila]|uniref:uncharacterized protein LOC119083782 isoform X2 n=1 Tax=Bradysia coprophila TaxID=38358 RepID=UPI00187D7864|nr:uncharacterized protein LOC119083782 isoform X2 [Bradysia coprophila]
MLKVWFVGFTKGISYSKSMDRYQINFREHHFFIKYHKPGNPIRLIVSTIDSAAYKMSRFLATILRKAFNPKFGIKNSQQFIRTIRKTRITKGNVLVSYDVVNCFGTIPTSLALSIIERDFHMIEKVTPIPKESFLQMLKLCLEQANYFVFADKFYRQKLGMFMGSSLAPILVERVIEHIVESAIRDLNITPDFWNTYVDDHLTSIQREMADQLLHQLNSYDPNVQFTMEVEKDDGTIEFLDTTVYNEGERLKTKWFHKPIASNRLLNYYSKHPSNMVINTAKSFIRRVLTLSHASFHSEMKHTVMRILEKNNFPAKLISKLFHQVCQTMNGRQTSAGSSYPFIDRTQATLVHQSVDTADNNNTIPIASSTLINETIQPVAPSTVIKRFVGMTYVPQLTEAVSRQIRKFAPNVTIAPRPPRKVSSVFSDMKQKLSTDQCSCVVYNVPCHDCPKSYVGETTWRLSDRQGQHQKDLDNMSKNPQKTALVHHAYTKGHAFEFRKKTILKKVRTKATIKIHEANQIILKGKSAVNFKTDAAHVSPVFYNLIRNSDVNLQQLFDER